MILFLFKQSLWSLDTLRVCHVNPQVLAVALAAAQGHFQCSWVPFWLHPALGAAGYSPMAGGWFLLPLLLLLDLAGSTPKAKVSLLSLDESGSRLCFQCSRKPLLAPPGFADLVTSV